MNHAMQAYREDREGGFTLIELLVVVIIIGILAAIAIPAFLNQREGAWRSSVESDLRNAAIALETYYSEADAYPATDAELTEAEAAALDPDLELQLSNGTQAALAPADDTVPSISFTNDDDGTYCITGFHQELDAVVAVYDSAAGGLLDDPAAGCA